MSEQIDLLQNLVVQQQRFLALLSMSLDGAPELKARFETVRDQLRLVDALQFSLGRFVSAAEVGRRMRAVSALGSKGLDLSAVLGFTEVGRDNVTFF